MNCTTLCLFVLLCDTVRQIRDVLLSDKAGAGFELDVDFELVMFCIDLFSVCGKIQILKLD